MSFTIALQTAALNKILKGVSLTTAPVWVSLHTADPGETGADEVTGGSYARQPVATTEWTAAVGGVSQNTELISYLDMPACGVTHIGLWSAVTGGMFLLADLVGDSIGDVIDVGSGDEFQIAAGGLVVSFEACVSTGLNASTYLQNKFLDLLLRDVDFSSDPVWVTVHDGDPGLTGVDELSVMRRQPEWADPAGGAAQSSADLVIPLPSGTLTWIGIWDAETSGNFLFKGPLTDPILAQLGNVLKIPAGDLVIAFGCELP